jgi:hypothetical protein
MGKESRISKRTRRTTLAAPALRLPVSTVALADDPVLIAYRARQIVWAQYGALVALVAIARR